MGAGFWLFDPFDIWEIKHNDTLYFGWLAVKPHGIYRCVLVVLNISSSYTFTISFFFPFSNVEYQSFQYFNYWTLSVRSVPMNFDWKLISLNRKESNTWESVKHLSKFYRKISFGFRYFSFEKSCHPKKGLSLIRWVLDN